jgi:hypothetical protein
MLISNGSLIRHLPGYYLVSFLIGRDLLDSIKVPRKPNNFLRGVLGLIPGGEKLYRKLVESGALEDAADWLEDQVENLETENEDSTK